MLCQCVCAKCARKLVKKGLDGTGKQEKNSVLSRKQKGRQLKVRAGIATTRIRLEARVGGRRHFATRDSRAASRTTSETTREHVRARPLCVDGLRTDHRVRRGEYY